MCKTTSSTADFQTFPSLFSLDPVKDKDEQGTGSVHLYARMKQDWLDGVNEFSFRLFIFTIWG